MVRRATFDGSTLEDESMRGDWLFALVMAMCGCGGNSSGGGADAAAETGAPDLGAAGDLATMAGADLGSCAGTVASCGAAGACVQCPTPQNSVATCMNSQCGSTCAPNAATCNGACIDTMNDGANCGRCDHGCLGGGCSMGACMPNPLPAIIFYARHNIQRRTDRRA